MWQISAVTRLSWGRVGASSASDGLTERKGVQGSEPKRKTQNKKGGDYGRDSSEAENASDAH